MGLGLVPSIGIGASIYAGQKLLSYAFPYTVVRRGDPETTRQKIRRVFFEFVEKSPALSAWITMASSNIHYSAVYTLWEKTAMLSVSAHWPTVIFLLCIPNSIFIHALRKCLAYVTIHLACVSIEDYGCECLGSFFARASRFVNPPNIIELRDRYTEWEFLFGEEIANPSMRADSQRTLNSRSNLAHLSKHQCLTTSIAETLAFAHKIYKRHRRRPEIARQIAIIHYPSHQRNLPLEIPIQFHEDEFFAAHICPITAKPIRFPAFLEENGHRHYFEEEAINSWTNSCGLGHRPITNPATRAEFRIADIRVDRELNRQIEQRLTLLLSQQGQET